MDAIREIVGGLQVGCQSMSAAVQIVARVAYFEGWTRLDENIVQLHGMRDKLGSLKTYVVRPVGFFLMMQTVFRAKVLSPVVQKGITGVTEDLKGYANLSLALMPAYKIWEFYKGFNRPQAQNEDASAGLTAFKVSILGLAKDQTLDVSAWLTVFATGTKFLTDLKLGLSFLSGKFPGLKISLAEFSPKTSSAISWLTSDYATLAGALINVYQNARGISLAGLQEVAKAPDMRVLNRNEGPQRELVRKTLNVFMYSSLAATTVYKIFQNRVVGSRPWAVFNLVGFGVSVGSSILYERWNADRKKFGR